MNVLVINAANERHAFSGNLKECLKEANKIRSGTRFAVVVESNKGRRLTMKRQDEITQRFFKQKVN